jgi:hypothetical protein
MPGRPDALSYFAFMLRVCVIRFSISFCEYISPKAFRLPSGRSQIRNIVFHPWLRFPLPIQAMAPPCGAGPQLGLSGRFRKARGQPGLHIPQSLRPEDFTVLYNAACGFANAGGLERALDLLERAVRTGRGFRAWIEHDPDLDSLRSLPRYQEILARLAP